MGDVRCVKKTYVSGLNSRKRQEDFNQKIIGNNDLNPNVMMLTETHLTRPIIFKDWHVTQTRMERKGGALVATSLLRSKAIKTLGSAVAWASVLDDTQPVHLLSVYLAPNKQKDTNETIDRLLIAVDNILSKLPSRKILVAGDFNE